jgi:hypothetical protein
LDPLLGNIDVLREYTKQIINSKGENGLLQQNHELEEIVGNYCSLVGGEIEGLGAENWCCVGGK